MEFFENPVNFHEKSHYNTIKAKGGLMYGGNNGILHRLRLIRSVFLC